MGTDLTKEFLHGFYTDGQAKNPFIWSSDSWLAFNAGAEFAKQSTAPIVKARKSRGYSIKVETTDRDFVVAFDSATLARCSINPA